MHPYTHHLLEDILNAYRPKDFFRRKKNALPEAEIENRLEEVDKFLNHREAPAFGNYCGLNFTDFPPGEKLEEEDIRSLTEALVKMFGSWNILVDLPENLPADLGYKLTVGLLEKPMPIFQHGFFGMDFCSGNPVGCEFKEYCPCLKHRDVV